MSELEKLVERAIARIEETGQLLCDWQGRPDRQALIAERTELSALVAQYNELRKAA